MQNLTLRFVLPSHIHSDKLKDILWSRVGVASEILIRSSVHSQDPNYTNHIITIYDILLRLEVQNRESLAIHFAIFDENFFRQLFIPQVSINEDAFG